MPRHVRPCARVRLPLLAGLLTLLACLLPASALAAVTPIITAPAPGSFVAASPVHVTWTETAPDTTSSFDLFVSSPGCDTSGPSVANVPSDGVSTDYAADVPIGPGDGPYCVTVVAHDTLGSDPDGAAVSVNLDRTAPDVPGNLTATNPSDEFPALSWDASGDHGGSGVAGYTVSRNGVPIASLPASQRTYTDTAVGIGSFTYGVTATDAVG